MFGRKVIRKLGTHPRGKLRKLYQSHSLTELSELFGTDESTVMNAMRHLRIARRTQHTPAPKGLVAKTLTRRGHTTNRSARQMFVLMYRTHGKSLDEVASTIGASRSAVYKFAVDHDISLRRVGRPRG